VIASNLSIERSGGNPRAPPNDVPLTVSIEYLPILTPLTTDG
jgi:hypothetical protein